MSVQADLVEIFSSVQGEGPHVGRSTLFVRFGGCDLRCAWCDSPQTWLPSRHCRIETARGRETFRVEDNPVTVGTILAAAEALELAAHRTVSLTGGEPLLQPRALEAVARALRDRGPSVHLETHGLAVDALRSVVDAVDVVSMDWKLASDVRRANTSKRATAVPFDAEHRDFLEVARQAPEVFVKVVVTGHTRDDELDALAAHVGAVDAAIPVIVQPVTPFGSVDTPIEAQRVLECARRLEGRLADVRVIPQTHKLFGAL